MSSFHFKKDLKARLATTTGSPWTYMRQERISKMKKIILSPALSNLAP